MTCRYCKLIILDLRLSVKIFVINSHLYPIITIKYKNKVSIQIEYHEYKSFVLAKIYSLAIQSSVCSNAFESNGDLNKKVKKYCL